MLNSESGLDALASLYLTSLDGGGSPPESAASGGAAAANPPIGGEAAAGDEVDLLVAIEDGMVGEGEGVVVPDGAGDGEPSADGQPKKFTVKVDGEELEVDEAELKSGYSREKDYTRKTTKLAEERKAFEAEQSSVVRERGLYGQVLEKWEAGITSVLAEFLPPDFEAMRDYDPAGYLSIKEKVQKHEQTLLQIAAEKERISNEGKEEHKRRFVDVVKTESGKLLALVPEWSDASVRSKEIASVAEYAKTRFGLTDAEVSSTVSSAVWAAMRDSQKYQAILDRRNSVKPKVAVKAAPAGSGSRPPSKKASAGEAEARLKKTGSARDYAALLLEREA